jgi:hypothetical protein
LEKPYIYGFRIERFIPCRIEPAHATRKIRPIPILRLDIVGVLRNAIIDPIECFDEFLKLGEHGAPSKQGKQEEYPVYFQPKTFDFWVVGTKL